MSEPPLLDYAKRGMAQPELTEPGQVPAGEFLRFCCVVVGILVLFVLALSVVAFAIYNK